ncbi:hypothetical protein [Akkermansia sp.]|uniref:hypothetical protein n=1 Tax=Akkermansia sp. TaxID=1872421 RepID=UPI0025C25BEB|nr:hypothetical protein [Akkermansia sp.]MCC8149515.1 hypothetical protein [Akkermansia sp.]
MEPKSFPIFRTSFYSLLIGAGLASCGGSGNSGETGESLVGKVYNIVIQTGNLPEAAQTALAETGIGGFVMTPSSVMTGTLTSSTGNISNGGYISYYYQKTGTDTASLKLYYTVKKRTNLLGVGGLVQNSYNMHLTWNELKYGNNGTHAEGDCIINIPQAAVEFPHAVPPQANPFANNAAVSPSTITISDANSVAPTN